MADFEEELRYVLFEFLSDIYESCFQNTTVMRLLTNSLLHYCYLPLVIPALVGTNTRSQTQIGISTALLVTTLTFRCLKSSEIQNSIAAILLSNRIPLLFKKTLTQKNGPSDPVVTYKQKWMYRLQVHYNKVKFMMEYLSNDCFTAFAHEFAPHIKFCADIKDKLSFGIDQVG